MLTPLLPIFDVKAGLALVYIWRQVRIMWKSTLTDKMQIVGILVTPAKIIWGQNKISLVYFFSKVLRRYTSQIRILFSLFWIKSLGCLGFTYSSYCGIYIIWGLSWVEMCWGPNYLFLILLLLLLESVADFKEVSSMNDLFSFLSGWI